MGEAKRKRGNAHMFGPWPGGPARCPKCLGTQVACEAAPPGVKFYGKRIAICGPCGIAWEPIDETSIWDKTDPACSGSEPCDNCAFRPGSPEQKDTERWKTLIETLRAGGTFYCHKGVPLAPGSEHGFEYPMLKLDVLGHEVKTYATANMRLCRGYLNALGVWLKQTSL